MVRLFLSGTVATVEESRPDQITFVRDLEILIGTMGNLQEALDARSLRADFEIDGQDTSSSLSTCRPYRKNGKTQVHYN